MRDFFYIMNTFNHIVFIFNSPKLCFMIVCNLLIALCKKNFPENFTEVFANNKFNKFELLCFISTLIIMSIYFFLINEKYNSTIFTQSMKYFSATNTISIKASSLRTVRVVVPLEHCWLNPNRVIQVPMIFSHTNCIVPYHFYPFLFFMLVRYLF